jgi:hypothetical protein
MNKIKFIDRRPVRAIPEKRYAQIWKRDENNNYHNSIT